MRRNFRNSSRWVFAVVFWGVFLFSFPLNQGFLISHLEQILNDTLGFKTTIGGLRFADANQIILSDVVMSDPEMGSNEPDQILLKIKRIRLDYVLPELLQSKIRGLSVEEPELTLSPQRFEKMKKRFHPEVAVNAAKRDLKLDSQQIERSKSGFVIENINVSGGHLTLKVKDKTYEASGFTLQVGRLSKQTVTDVSFVINFALNRRHSGRLSYRLKELNLSTQAIRGSLLTLGDFDIPFLMSILAERPEFPWAVGKWKGLINLEVNTPSAQEPTQTQVSVAGLEYESPDATRAIAGFSLLGKLNSKLKSQTLSSGFSSDADFFVKGGALLWGTYFHDFSGKSLTLKSVLDFTEQNNLQGRFNLSGLESGRAHGQVVVAGERKKFEINSEISSLEKLYANGVGTFLKATFPSAFGETPLQGRVASRVIAQWQQNRLTELSGSLNGQDLTYATSQKTFLVQGANVKTDFQVAFPEKGLVLNVRHGQLAWEHFEWGNLGFGPGKMQTQIVRNRAVLLHPVSSEIARGILEIPNLIIGDVRNPLAELRGGIRLSPVNLFSVSQQLKIFPFVGSLEGNFPKVVFEKGRLMTNGKLFAKAFQGIWTLDQLHGEGFGTGAIQLGFDASCDFVNMGLLSQLSNFGYITGVLRATAKQVELQNGSLTAFDLDVGTLLDPKVKYEVGIEAVRKITIFAGGLSALKFLDQGIYKAFDSYDYEGMGGRFTLKDNLLFAKAHFERDGKKLFLKGRGLPRLDIVYNEGGGAISWTAFLQQLKSVELKLKKEGKS